MATEHGVEHLLAVDCQPKRLPDPGVFERLDVDAHREGVEATPRRDDDLLARAGNGPDCRLRQQVDDIHLAAQQSVDLTRLVLEVGHDQLVEVRQRRVPVVLIAREDALLAGGEAHILEGASSDGL